MPLKMVNSYVKNVYEEKFDTLDKVSSLVGAHSVFSPDGDGNNALKVDSTPARVATTSFEKNKTEFYSEYDVQPLKTYTESLTRREWVTLLVEVVEASPDLDCDGIEDDHINTIRARFTFTEDHTVAGSEKCNGNIYSEHGCDKDNYRKGLSRDTIKWPLDGDGAYLGLLSSFYTSDYYADSDYYLTGSTTLDDTKLTEVSLITYGINGSAETCYFDDFSIAVLEKTTKGLIPGILEE